jgi:PadR family transcriptional regulator AphA
VEDHDLSVTEWVVLALLSEEPAHGFALARQLRAGADLGRVLTVHRSLVYRAIDRLVAAGLAEPQRSEPGDGGPTRTLHRTTHRGCVALDAWFDRPVGHVRDMRIELLAKLRLMERAGRDPAQLMAAQRAALADTLAHVIAAAAADDSDVVDRWRRHNGRAAAAFLDELADLHPLGPSPYPAGS